MFCSTLHFLEKKEKDLQIPGFIPTFASQKCIWEAPLHPSAL